MKIGVSNGPIGETADNFIMPFGKYKGEPITRVPTETLVYYLRWDKLSSHMRSIIEEELSKNNRQRELQILEEIDLDKMAEEADDWDINWYPDDEEDDD